MSQQSPNINTLGKNNWNTYKKGALLGIIGGPLVAIFLLLTYYFIFADEFNTVGIVNFFFNAPILVGFVFVFMILINIFIAILFMIINRYSIGMEDTKKWTFYVAEIVVLPIAAIALAVF